MSPRIKVLFHWHSNCMFKENQLSLSCHSSAITYASLSFVTHVLMHEPLSFLLNIVYFVRDWRVEQPVLYTFLMWDAKPDLPIPRTVMCFVHLIVSSAMTSEGTSTPRLSLVSLLFCCPQFSQSAHFFHAHLTARI